MMSLLKIGIFSLIVYTISFVLVYKKGIITKPWEFLMGIFGLKDSLICMICTPFWISGILSAINIFVLPEMSLSPSMVLFGKSEILIYYIGSIGLDMFAVASIVYLIDQFNSYFLEYRGKLDVTIHSDKPEKQILND